MVLNINFTQRHSHMFTSNYIKNKHLDFPFFLNFSQFTVKRGKVLLSRAILGTLKLVSIILEKEYRLRKNSKVYQLLISASVDSTCISCHMTL